LLSKLVEENQIGKIIVDIGIVLFESILCYIVYIDLPVVNVVDLIVALVAFDSTNMSEDAGMCIFTII